MPNLIKKSWTVSINEQYELYKTGRQNGKPKGVDQTN